MAINTSYKPGELPANHPISFLHGLGTDGNPAPVALDANGAIKMTLNNSLINSGTAAAVTSSSPTLTAAQLLTGLVLASGQTTAQTHTLPTATLMAAAIPAVATGTWFEFSIQNNNSSSGAITVSAGSGGSTATGTFTIAIQKTRRFRLEFTSTAAYTLYSLGDVTH